MKKLFIGLFSITVLAAVLCSCSVFGDLKRRGSGTSSSPDISDSMVVKQYSSVVNNNYDTPEALDLSDNLAVIGCYPENPGGMVYIYGRDLGGADQWGLEKSFSESNSGDSFGQTVSLSGNLLAVSAPFADAGGLLRGTVFLYSRDQGGAGNWGLIKTFLPDVTTAFNNFGDRILLKGDDLLVRARNDANYGNVYLFSRNYGGADNWGQVRKFSQYRSEASVDEQRTFGKGIALDGDTLVIGYPMISHSGSVYVYMRNSGGAGNWGLVKTITNGEFYNTDHFGEAVSLYGDTLAVGSYNGSFYGAVYVYKRNQGGADNWGLVRELRETNDNPCNTYGGYAICLYGDLLAASAIGDHVDGMYRGRVYLYGRNVGGTENWGLMRSLIEENRVDYNGYGKRIVMNSNDIFIGCGSELINGSYYRMAYLMLDFLQY